MNACGADPKCRELRQRGKGSVGYALDDGRAQCFPSFRASPFPDARACPALGLGTWKMGEHPKRAAGRSRSAQRWASTSG
jgi:hypothetical protein